MKLIDGKTGKWEYVIGLEVHAQISSNSKLFSGAKTDFGSGPNENVSFIDAAMPGMLPVLNKECVRLAVKTGLALNLDINKYSVFDRKNYFYADLPLGYQISQFYHPIATNGYLKILRADGEYKKIIINRLHIEQDAGKSIHDQMVDNSLIDLNRCGVALMEIVTDPDISSPEEAVEYIKKLRAVLRYIGSCDGDMEKGSFRCDANISVRRPGEGLGTRCEIKNLNSTKHITKAIEFEALRQIEIIEAGGVVAQETRLFDSINGETRTMRSKENSTDYRYFPDPDLIPLNLEDDYIDSIKNSLEELPDQKSIRYMSDMGLTHYETEVLVSDKNVADFFEQAASETSDKKSLANWIIGELFSYLNRSNTELIDCKIKPTHLAKLINMIYQGKISGKIAKTIFQDMFETGSDPELLVVEKGLSQISDDAQIEKYIDSVIASNQDKVIEYKSGKDKLFGFFVGQVMKLSEGKANPSMINEILKQKLEDFS
jgi:aspartyl-tRNA(Asn)/glutamyl-tRNA(Gln) amidotransferase subunit B